MLKRVISVALLALTVSLCYLMDQGVGRVPPLGKFLSPFIGFWQNSGDGIYKWEDIPQLKGLSEPVTIHLDKYRIPHVVATNNADLYFTQGYLTARDRLWQMDFISYAASGRICELVGKRALDYDRTQRRLGLPRAAVATTKLLESDTLALRLMTAYSDGINTYINQLSYKDLPVEYKLMNYAPEPWTYYKSALLLKFMGKMLTGRDYDREYTNAIQLLGKETFNLLFPDFPQGLDPIVGSENLSTVNTPVTTDNSAVSDNVQFPINPYEQPAPNMGSNNWAISPEKSTTGAPILCSDPHLGMRIPSIWHQMQLTSNDMNVYGVTIPGAPGITIGFNEQIAWGVTNASMDVRDWFEIKFKDSTRDQYLFDNNWKNTEKVIEEIKIKDEVTFYDTIVYTHHGPVVYDESFTGGSDTITNLALQWTAHSPSKELKTFYELNRSKNLEDYLKALDHYECPGQNFAFASLNGDIAIKEQGKFLLRKPMQGKFVQDGSNPENDWNGFIPSANNPTQINPERGFVSSANQHPTDSTYPYYYSGIYEYFRNRRINKVLSSRPKFSIEDMKHLQNDNYNLIAEEVLPLILDSIERNSLSEFGSKLYEELAGWNYYNEIDLLGPTIFESVWNNLYEILWDEFLPSEETQMTAPNIYNTIRFMHNQPSHNLMDNKSTEQIEDLGDLVNRAFKSTIEDLTDWEDSTGKELSWANYKGTRLAHWALIEPFYIQDIPIGGNKHIVNATSRTHGASWRMVVALGDTIQAWGIYPGGQSGNPGSPFYANQVESWAKGEYYPLLFMTEKNTFKEEVIATQTLEPNK